MTGLLSQVPGRLLGALLLVSISLVGLTALLAKHAVRRMLDIPRVPRPLAMYVVLGGTWLALVAGGSAVVGAIVLLRDYQSVDRPTALAEVRCASDANARLQLELRTGTSTEPERYAVDGDSCVVWVKQVELRPGLQPFGIQALSRIDAIGPAVRPATNPGWLTPDSRDPVRLLSLVVRNTTMVPLSVPRDIRARVVLVSSPTGPMIQQTPI